MLETLLTYGNLLLIIGIVLIGIEFFVPGFGLFGISGGVALVVGIVLTAQSVEQALVLILLTIVVLSILGSIVIRLIDKRKLNDQLILYENLKSEENELLYFLGKEGLTLTKLRPSGKVEFEGVTLDVVSNGTFIDKDVLVKIVKIEGNKILVEKSKA